MTGFMSIIRKASDAETEMKAMVFLTALFLPNMTMKKAPRKSTIME